MRTHHLGCKQKGYWPTMGFFQLGISITILSLLFAGSYAVADNGNQNEETLVQDEEAIPSISDYRLPKTIVPTGYQIMLIPQLENTFEFEGTVHIRATAQKTINVITLHHGQININKTTVTSITSLDEQQEILSTAYNDTTEKYEIRLKNPLPQGMHFSINVYYTGKLRDDMIGFYRSSYFDSNGKIRWLASTQFQTTHARHAFPCFDEPSFKATFIVRILRKKEYSCLSNMPLKDTTETKEGEFWDEFEQSIPMSTYLVAFIVSDFKYRQESSFKVWARPNAIDQAQYALSVGPRALEQLSKWFKQPYQIGKMDMVAVPDFSAGAMENWGLVTYRESRLLYDSKTTSDAGQQSIASVIVHELTHMWFGNQITPEWWSYLWLSEAFARYFQYFGTALIEKSWKMEDQFLVEQHQTAMAADGLETSQPMTRDVSSSSQMGNIGDTITYNKGASIVRMMSFIFGQDVFQTGLQNYLENNKEIKVARPENLWVELQNEINRRKQPLAAPVKDIMSTWTAQAGYPIVAISIENGVATVRQRRFLLRNLQATATNATWWIPMTWTSSDKPNFNDVQTKSWLSKEGRTIDLGKPSGWVIFNVQASGFYRVTYDNASWYRIIDALNSPKYQEIHVLNRAALVDDLLNLARAGMVVYETALDGLKYLTQEKDYLPFKSAFSSLTYLDQRFCGHPESYDLLKEFVLILIKNRYNELGYFDNPGDDRLTILLRSELNKWACNYGHQGCIRVFTNLFHQWRKNNSQTIAPNQRAVAYCTAIRYGTPDDWEFLWSQYINSNSATDQSVILQALGCTQNTSYVERYLLNSLTSFEKYRIRKQDSTAIFSAIHGTGIAGAEAVLNFVDKYHSQISAYYGGEGTIASILASASQRFSTPELVDKFQNMIDYSPHLNDIAISLRKSWKIAKYELAWFDNFKRPIIAWITNFVKKNENLEGYILPKDVIPKAYQINLKPQVNETTNFMFNGTVKISAEVAKTTTAIVLHSAELVHSKVLVYKGQTAVKVNAVIPNNKYDFLVIELGQALTVEDKITIEIEYSGYLNEDMRGFYRSWYEDDWGNRRWLAATHLEPVAARKVFPCFDEPALKATFRIEVTVQPDYGAVSNTMIDSVIRHENGEQTITFRETPRMSTYLVALIVSDFESLNQYGMYGVWARPNAISQTKHALSAMDPLLQFYQKALRLPYQLQKLDMVALPDFASGAMENWGLLTYKERNLLYHNYHTTTAQKQSITNVIAHEIAHQWFGNLVSPEWWKYLWLNEAFARYFQYFATINVEPGWSLETQFVVDQVHSALEADSALSSHPMTHDVYSPTQIRSIFDSISYAKGASVLRMMEKSIGHDTFYKALQIYLEAKKYDVAKPQDLFDAFKAAIADTPTKNSIDNIMNSWTTQTGYPIVYVTHQNDTVYLRQERFLMKGPSSSDKSIWYVPITWTPLNDPNFTDTTPRSWFKDAQSSIKVPGANKTFLILNIQQAGFYRTNYDKRTWDGLIDFLQTDQYKEIHESNRAALIDDLMNFGRAGYVDYQTVLSATQYLGRETDYAPWRAFFNGLTHLRRHLQGTDAQIAFKQYLSAILGPIYDWYGYHDRFRESHVTKILKTHLRKWACEMEVSDCALSAVAFLFGNETSFVNEMLVQPNLRSTSYCTAVRLIPYNLWSDLWYLYSISESSTGKSIILQSLACTTDTPLLNKLLEYAISYNSGIRFEDSSGVFTSVINAHVEGADTVMDFIKNNYDRMVTYYRDVSQVKSIVSTLGRRLSTDELYTKYMNLIDWLSQKDLALRSSLQLYKSIAEEELQWTEKYIPKIHEWCENNYPDRSHRLPLLFSPLKYNISLSPSFQEGGFKFNGKVQIHLKRMQGRVSRIVLNAQELTIKNVSVYSSNPNSEKRESLEVSSLLRNEFTQRVTIFTKSFIKSDYVIVEIEYDGDLNDRMEGFYRSYYFDDEKNIRWLAATQFEPTHARRAFPCLDEPAFKAKFRISIERPNDYVALSNMPLELSAPSRFYWNLNPPYAQSTPKCRGFSVAGRTWDTFAESVKMSPYLVAFVVCDFKTVRGTIGKVNVWGRPSIAANGDLAEIAGMRMLELLEDETQHDYALTQLDLIGIPDFSMGAMENWGLATFREYGLFYNQNVTSAKYTDYILTIIAHELAHMWYGNLVTCDWWEYIWLNEGFAEYMQWVIADKFRPSHGFDDLFVTDELQVAMLNDDYQSSHPMNNPVSAPSEIANVFDKIAYGKASSVIRMIHNSLEPSIFPLATKKYLSQNQYGTATPKELWKAFDEAIKETHGFGDWDADMETLMDSWTNKAGYPLVSVSWYADVLTLKQKRFAYRKSFDNVVFWIPITMASASKPDFNKTSTTLWMGSTTLKIRVGELNEWMLLNVRQSGYYRVKYTDQLWFRLFGALRQKDHSNIHVTNRAQIVDDLLNLARAGEVTYSVAFNGTVYLLAEKEYLPWKAFFNGISFIAQRYESPNATIILQDYILPLAMNQYQRLGFKDSNKDTHQDQLSRELILSWVCKLKHTGCVETAKKLFADWRRDPKKVISPNARAAVYCSALRSGNQDDWDFLWNSYLETNFASEKKIILDALGCTTDKDLLNRYIQYALTRNYVSDIRKQDVEAALASVYNSGYIGVEVMMSFLLEKYQEVYEYYGNWESVGQLFLKVTSRISTTEQIERYKQFLGARREELQTIMQTLIKGLETAEENYQWFSKNNVSIIYSIDMFRIRNGAATVQGLSIIVVTVVSIITYAFGS